MVGQCSRALVAWRLKYDPLPQSKIDIDKLNYYSRLEAIAAAQLLDLGYRIEPTTKCLTCLERYGIERYGIHVEIDTPLFLLVGHLDRRLILDDDRRLPVEIKSLGKSSWHKFQSQQLSGFPSYAGQECAYLEAEKQPGIYWVLNRDTGDPLKYIVNDTKDTVKLDGFDKITLPITFDQILDKLNLVEIDVQSNTLSEPEESGDCFWCRYKYLCARKDERNLAVVTSSIVVEAAETYKSADDLEKQSKEMKDEARDILLFHCKQSGIEKYKCSGLSVSFRGTRVKTWLDESVIRKEAPPELIRLAERKSEPFPDYTIRRTKE